MNRTATKVCTLERGNDFIYSMTCVGGSQCGNGKSISSVMTDFTVYQLKNVFLFTNYLAYISFESNAELWTIRGQTHMLRFPCPYTHRPFIPTLSTWPWTGCWMIGRMNNWHVFLWVDSIQVSSMVLATGLLERTFWFCFFSTYVT